MFDVIKKRTRSKAYWLGIAVFAAGFAEANMHLISQLIPEEYRAIAVQAVGLAIMLVREMTNKSLSEK